MLPFSIPINIHTIFENCFIHDSCFLLPTRVATTELFSMKDDISLKRMVSYYQIKVLELLFYLESINLQIEKVEKTYNRMQINIVKNCHDYLIAHIDKKLTISYLATHFCISETTLKAVFKEIYGKPIFAFMKEYRMKQAEHLLLDTSYTIAQVSTMLGYETQSKFGATFKKMVGVSPNEYRNTKQ
jgi:AraC-like DNA-binding protein